MKKVLFSILALSLLTGCSINIDTDKDEDKKENNNQQVENNGKENNEQTIDYKTFIKEGTTYLETKESTVTLDGESHKLAYVYSWNMDEDEQCAGYVTVLFDGEVLNSELTNKQISGFSGESGCETSRPHITEKAIDGSKDTLALVITSGAWETGNTASVFVINSNGKVLSFSDEHNNFGVQYKSNHENYLNYDEELKTEYIKIENNKIITYTCDGIHEYTITDKDVEKKSSPYPTDTYLSGGC